MEFVFNVNILFPDLITRLTGKEVIRCQPEVQTVLDAVGEASRIAQGLHRPVTSAASFYNSDHIVYIFKDATANNGKGSILGLLKVGPKKLFLLNRQGTQNEIVPLCVLDFYVHESCQRKGLGKKLFEYFLKTENVEVVHLAIDRPSDKFLGFLRKHYRLANQIPQVNNFVIYDGFFQNRPEKNSSGEFSNYRRSVYGNADSYNPYEVRQPINSSRPMNRWSSVISLGNESWNSFPAVQQKNLTTQFADPIPVVRRNQSAVTHSFTQDPDTRNESLWRIHSCADVRRADTNNYTATIPAADKSASLQSSNPMKFQHHRLW